MPDFDHVPEFKFNMLRQQSESAEFLNATSFDIKTAPNTRLAVLLEFSLSGERVETLAVPLTITSASDLGRALQHAVKAQFHPEDETA